MTSATTLEQKEVDELIRLVYEWQMEGESDACYAKRIERQQETYAQGKWTPDQSMEMFWCMVGQPAKAERLVKRKMRAAEWAERERQRAAEMEKQRQLVLAEKRQAQYEQRQSRRQALRRAQGRAR